MKTQLEKKQDLIYKIKCLSSLDVQKLKVFMAGLEAGKTVKQSESTEHPSRP